MVQFVNVTKPALISHKLPMLVMEDDGGVAIISLENQQPISTFVTFSLPPMRTTHSAGQQEDQYNRRGIIVNHSHATQHASTGAIFF